MCSVYKHLFSIMFSFIFLWDNNILLKNLSIMYVYFPFTTLTGNKPFHQNRLRTKWNCNPITKYVLWFSNCKLSRSRRNKIPPSQQEITAVSSIRKWDVYFFTRSIKQLIIWELLITHIVQNMQCIVMYRYVAAWYNG